MMAPKVRAPRIIFRANGSMALSSYPCAYFPPQLALAGAGFCRVGKNGASLDLVVTRERGQGVAQPVGGELVRLGGDHQKVAISMAQEVDQLPVRRLCGDVGVDEHNCQLERR